MTRSRPKLSFSIIDESFVIPPGSLRSETVGACWAPDLHILANFSEVQSGNMRIKSNGDWFNRVKTFIAQSTGATIGGPNYTSIVFSGHGTDAGVTSGGAVGLLNGAPGATYQVNAISGSSGGTYVFTRTNNFRQEWWAVQNFLQYGGDCIVGFALNGFTGDLGAGGVPQGGALNSNGTIAAFASPGIGYDIVFQSSSPIGPSFGWTGDFSTHTSAAATNVVTITAALQDSERPVMGILNVGIASDVSGTAFDDADDIKAVSGTDEYNILVAGDKYHLNSLASSDTTTLIRTLLAPDIAGCIVRTDRNNSPWISPAGPDRGKILGVVKLSHKFTTTQQDLLYNVNVNPVITIAGQGTILYGDVTDATDTSSLVSINVIRTINYIKTQLLPLANSVLFGQNNESTRSRFSLQAKNFLSGIKNRGGLLEFTIVCDETNNPTSVIESKQFNVDLSVKIPGSINYINISLTNT